MRTRIFNKMTAQEVEDYLARGGDTIFIAIGVIECHGALPIDCETIGPVANAVLLAEKADGLAMINLPYFYPGATVISNATVNFSIRDGMRYLNKLCHSLVDQGFRKLFLLSGHGPAPMTINAFCRDFFEETLIHPCHLMRLENGGMPSFPKIDPKTGPTEEQKEFFRKMSLKTYGAYKIMGQMEYLPIDPEGKGCDGPRTPVDPRMKKLSQLYSGYGGYTCQLYSDPAQHGGGYLFKDEQQRLEWCTEGEQVLREMIDKCKINELKEALGEYQDYVQRMYQKFPRIKKEH